MTPAPLPNCMACQRIAQTAHGENPMFIADLRESIAVLADHQYYEGWCILLLKDHHEHLAKLPVDRQRRLYEDVISMAGAIDKAFRPVRLNFENLGNEMHHIHWHIIPRYSWDPEPKKPIWLRSAAEYQTGCDPDRANSLIARIREHLAK